MMKKFESQAVLASYDGEAVPPKPDDTKKFTQEDVNRFMSKEAQKQKGQLAAYEKTLQEMSESKNLSVKEREGLAAQLEEMQAARRTQEEQSAHEKALLEKSFQKKAADLEKTAKEWETRYREGTIDQALTEAAVKSEAFNVAQFITQLRPMTRLVEVTDEKTGKGTGKFKVVVDLPDTDPNTGEPIVVPHTPASAAKRMKEMAEHANLFKSGVVSGIGSSSGIPTGAGGKVDPKTLTQAQYMELREKHPELLGLRPQKDRHRRL